MARTKSKKKTKKSNKSKQNANDKDKVRDKDNAKDGRAKDQKSGTDDRDEIHVSVPEIRSSMPPMTNLMEHKALKEYKTRKKSVLPAPGVIPAPVVLPAPVVALISEVSLLKRKLAARNEDIQTLQRLRKQRLRNDLKHNVQWNDDLRVEPTTVVSDLDVSPSTSNLIDLTLPASQATRVSVSVRPPKFPVGNLICNRTQRDNWLFGVRTFRLSSRLREDQAYAVLRSSIPPAFQALFCHKEVKNIPQLVCFVKQHFASSTTYQKIRYQRLHQEYGETPFEFWMRFSTVSVSLKLSAIEKGLAFISGLKKVVSDKVIPALKARIPDTSRWTLPVVIQILQKIGLLNDNDSKRRVIEIIIRDITVIILLMSIVIIKIEGIIDEMENLCLMAHAIDVEIEDIR